MLKDEELAEEKEARSLYEAEEKGQAARAPRTVTFDGELPIAFFDFIIVDECHRSIYTVWRQVLEYFDGINVPGEVYRILTRISDQGSSVEAGHWIDKKDKLTREEFGKGNDFCQKVTYKAHRDPDDILQDFRNSYYPRVAVTVDMIATGADHPP